MRTPNTVCKNSITELLRGWVGRHAMPAETVARMTGITERVIRSHLDPTSPNMPNAAHMAAYMSLFGPVFTNLYLGMFGQTGAHEETSAEICARSFMTAEASFVAFLSAVLEDDVIDHKEGIQLRHVALERASASISLASAIENKSLKEFA